MFFPIERPGGKASAQLASNLRTVRQQSGYKVGVELSLGMMCM